MQAQAWAFEDVLASVAVSLPMMSPYAAANAGSKPAATPIVIGREVAGGDGVPSPIPTPTGPLVMRKRGMPRSSMAATCRSTRIWAASCSISSGVSA